MTTRLFSLSLAALLSLPLIGSPTPATAANGDCGQPVSTGASPTASDCLFILKVAVGSQTCDPACICNTDGNPPTGGTSATDALLCLKIAVGQPGVSLNCMPTPCPPTTIPTAKCSSADFIADYGSDLDTGWKGTGHNAEVTVGAKISVRILKRCTNDQSVCTKDSECSGGTCELTCDCDDPNNSDCEVIGPTHQKRCLISLAPCNVDGDCPAGQTCESFFGPPLPLSAEGTPACVTSYFQQDVTGTANPQTGEGSVSSFLRSRVHLGISLDKPCPRCGAPAQDPKIGDSFTCDGGPKNGTPCTVEAISPDFGGVSSTCPPDVATNVSGIGLAILFDNVTTGVVTRQAVLPCPAPLDFHPDNGNAFCLNHSSTSCTSNADCAAFGGTCGIYCHCGYCDGDVDAPCFDDSQCPQGTTCQAGMPDTPAEPQERPNLCSSLVCGAEQGLELCDSNTAPIGECSLESFRSCSNDSDCSTIGAGTCILSPRPCFENTITRTGVPSPLGGHCIDDPTVEACNSNADCNTGNCVGDTSEPTSVALFCVPPTSSTAINSAGGIPGPGAISFKSVVKTCRCGDGIIGCDETCEVGDDSACPGACDLENCLCE
jgi:hypothetical protein